MIATKPPKIGNYVKERFKLPDSFKDALKLRNSPFETPFAEFVYYRTYSRIMADGGQETWADTVSRVIEGVMSIRKQHYYSMNIHWSKSYWTSLAEKMAESMFKMEWLPPGRGLWAMGTDYVYERGAMSLYNCAFTNLGSDSFSKDIEWLMDALMNGVGVGFAPVRDDFEYLVRKPSGIPITVQVGDDREGWAESERLLIESYLRSRDRRPVEMDYSKVRPEGTPISGFGGTASGPEPLRKLHARTIVLLNRLCEGTIDVVQFKTDLANAVGCCVVAGNIRRSAEMGLAPMDDPVFKNLKDYVKYPDRADLGWMSNNSVYLASAEDFEQIDEIAERVVRGEDLGFFNTMATKRGRLGHDDGLEADIAIGLNPCGEIPLEDKEVCNLSETLPTRCGSTNDWLRACRYASFYSSTVSLLPTHDRRTNSMILKNRRIGVSIIDVSGWKLNKGVAKVTRLMRRGYKIVKDTNHEFNSQAGVPDAIRNTTLKPGGTVPKIASRTSGNSNPTFKHTLMRVRVAQRHAIFGVLVAANVPHEPDVYSDNTEVFEFPVLQGPAKPAGEVSLWEQAFGLIMAQAEWADNAVSNTLYFRPKWQKSDVMKHIDRNNVAGFVNIYNIEGHHDVVLNAFDDVEDGDQPSMVVEIDHRFKLEFKRDGICVDLHMWIYDPKHEEEDVAPVLAHIAPMTKSVSLLPHSNKGAYRQMPQEGITEEEFERREAEIKPIDWSQFKDSDGQDEKFCDGDNCELPGKVEEYVEGVRTSETTDS